MLSVQRGNVQPHRDRRLDDLIQAQRSTTAAALVSVSSGGLRKADTRSCLPSPFLPVPDLVLPRSRLVSDTRERLSSEARPLMMHDMMHDGRDPSGRSRARQALRCDPLLGISLQALPTNPYLHPLWISFTPNSRFAVIQPNGRSIGAVRQKIS